jgi:hypothetical protein
MQRNLISTIFMVAAALISLSVGSWWLRATVLSPTSSVGATAAILDDEGIRNEITTIVSAATADRLGQPARQISEFIDPILDSKAGAAVMAEIIAAGHARLIGERQEPLRISGPEMVQIVRHEAVTELPPVTIPIGEVSSLSVIKTILWWTTLIPAIAALLAIGFAFFARPERRDLQVAMTALMFGLALSAVLFAVIIPIWGLPALSDTTWINAISRLARRTLLLVIPAILLFTGSGIASLLNTGSRPGRGRNQWTSPISSGRYVSDRNWYR